MRRHYKDKDNVNINYNEDNENNEDNEDNDTERTEQSYRFVTFETLQCSGHITFTDN